MKHIKKENTFVVELSDVCTVTEYPVVDEDISLGKAKINGRYPETGYCVNTMCKEMILVISGNGYLNKKEEKIKFNAGDVIIIDKNEPYFWDANCEFVMPCTPAWFPEQHKIVD